MLIELHSHTSEHSPCSHIAAAELVCLVCDAGADGIVLTDHHYLWPADKLAELRSDAAVADEFVILAGQEVYTRDFGDILVYGASQSIDPQPSLAQLRGRWPQAALVWAHPYRYGRRPTKAELLDSKLNAVEIVNPHQAHDENLKAIAEWKSYGFAATSGTDIHTNDVALFNFTDLNATITCIEDLMQALKEGRFRPTFAGARL